MQFWLLIHEAGLYPVDQFMYETNTWEKWGQNYALFVIGFPYRGYQYAVMYPHFGSTYCFPPGLSLMEYGFKHFLQLDKTKLIFRLQYPEEIPGNDLLRHHGWRKSVLREISGRPSLFHNGIHGSTGGHFPHRLRERYRPLRIE